MRGLLNDEVASRDPIEGMSPDYTTNLYIAGRMRPGTLKSR